MVMGYEGMRCLRAAPIALADTLNAMFNHLQ